MIRGWHLSGGVGEQRPSRRLAPAAAPLSYAQEMMWFLDRALPDPAVYHVPIAWRVNGTLDARNLQRALQRLAERHEQLRTSFPTVEGQPVALVSPGANVPLRERAAGDGTRLMEILRDEARQPFDLAQAPLFRALLVRDFEGVVLLLTFHHIVCDGWSLTTIQNDLLELYAAESEGRDAQLTGISLQYADFAVANRNDAANGVYDADAAWWAEHLRGLPRFELVGDRRPPAARSVRGDRVSRTLGPELTQRIRAFARAHRCTTFATLLAAFAAFLAKYSGENEIVLGVPVSGRRRVELTPLVGNFIEMATLRVAVDPARGFADAAQAAQGELFDALTFGGVPLQMIVDRAAPLRSQTQNAFSAVAMVEQPARHDAIAGGVTFRPLAVDTATAKFDLLLEVSEGPDDLSITFEYALDCFEPATAATLIEAYERFVLQALHDVDLPLEDVQFAAAPLERTAPAIDPAEPAASAALVQRRFRTHALATPDAIALQCGGASVTYARLMHAADAIRASLHAHGVERGDLIGLCAERSIGLVASIIAILDAGAAYVPLDPAYPAQRLGHIASHSGLRLVIADRASLGVVPQTGADVVVLDDALVLEPATLPPVDVDGSDAAYVIYTSGSTGTPKGVVVEHGNVARLFTAAERRFRFGPQDVWTLFHSYAFDFSVWEMWGALAYGGRLVIVPAEIVRAPRDVYDLVVACGVTVFNQTPSAFYEFDAADAAVGSPLPLRYVILGGESVDVRRLAGWFGRHGDRTPAVINMYGITETTVHVTYRELREADVDAALTPIGAPLDDLAIALIDAKGRPVPTGFTGEICVHGAGVARGYLNDPVATDARFRTVHDRSGSVRRYRSGDLARRRSDGTFDYVGRADAQVKIRGFRIEPGEIEAALATHPQVAQCVVLPDTKGADLRLIAYVVSRDENAGIADLRAHLGKMLPEYMIPSAFVPVRAIPRNENGKLDRHALAALEIPPHAVAAASEPAPTKDEIRLRSLFAELLQLPSVRLDDNFFALGGNSMLAARLAAHIYEMFPVEAARFEMRDGRNALLRAFYREPSVRALALILESPPNVDGPVVCLREGDTKQAAVFWFHGLYGSHGTYAWNVLAALPDAVPFYVVEPHGSAYERFSPDIGTLAQERLEQIQRVRPNGPYIVGGFCNGAIVAFEVARRLRNAGANVENLVMVSPAPLVPFGPWLAMAGHGFGKLGGVSEQRRVELVLKLRSVSERCDRLLKGTPQQRAAMVRVLTARLLGRPGEPDGPGFDALKAPQALWTENRYVHAITSYHPQRYHGRAEVIFGRGNLRWIATPHGGWAAHIDDPRVHAVAEPLISAESAGEIGRILGRFILAADPPAVMAR